MFGTCRRTGSAHEQKTSIRQARMMYGQQYVHTSARKIRHGVRGTVIPQGDTSHPHSSIHHQSALLAYSGGPGCRLPIDRYLRHSPHGPRSHLCKYSPSTDIPRARISALILLNMVKHCLCIASRARLQVQDSVWRMNPPTFQDCCSWEDRQAWHDPRAPASLALLPCLPCETQKAGFKLLILDALCCPVYPPRPFQCAARGHARTARHVSC